jgi:hypothetical protein
MSIPDEKPVFNTDDMSWGDTEQVWILSAQLQQAQATNNIELIKESLYGLRVALSSSVVSIPDSWLVNNKKGLNLDWSNPDNYSFIRGKLFMQLFELFTQAMNAENVSKN